MHINILYEDEDVVVVDKPAGVRVHRDAHATEETVADWHAARVPQAQGVGEPLHLSSGELLDRPGVVHRLDAETSGVIILAKTQEAFLFLKDAFKERRVEKEYRAFVFGSMKESAGVIDRPIGRNAQDFRLRSAQRGARGMLRPAETAWTRLQASAAYSYLKLEPKTGRTHQLRAHLKAVNHPIVGDRLYAPTQVARDPDALGFTRLALHAHTLTLALPSGERHTFTAPLPEDFLRAEGSIAGL